MHHGRRLARAPLYVGLLVAGVIALSAAHGPNAALLHAQNQSNVQTSDVSRNWAGYVDETPGIDGVSGTWTVPEVDPAAATAASSVWVGIGGSNTDDLIQAGTEQDVERGRAVYYAWFETLPAESQRVRLDVQPGDQMSVSITESAPNQWLIGIYDATSGGEVRLTRFYRSSNSSAEWIVEAPTAVNARTGSTQIVTLADFGTVHIGGMVETAAGVALDPTEATPVVMAMNHIKLVDVSYLQNSSFDAQYVGRTLLSAQ